MLEHKMKSTRNMKSFKWLRYHILACYYCIYILNMSMLTNETTELSSFDEVTELFENNLKIMCTVDLELSKVTECKNKDLTQHLELKNMTRVAETTIKLYLSRGGESDPVYECITTENVTKSSSSLLEIHIIGRGDNESDSPITESSVIAEAPICTVRKVIAEKPKDVLNFRCVLNPRLTLLCLWSEQRNYILTNYTIQFVPLNSTAKETVPTMCPYYEYTGNGDNELSSCSWSPTTTPKYSDIYEKLNISLIGRNRLGTNEQNFIFNKSEHMEPDRPFIDNFHSTSNSVTLWWYHHINQHHPVEWMYELQLWTDSKEETILLNSTDVNKYGYTAYNVTELTPNTNYTLYLRMKSRSALSFDEYWSDFSKIIVQTKPLPATHVAETDHTLFRIYYKYEDTSYRRISIFWKPMDDFTRWQFGDLHYEIEAFKVDQNGNNEVDIDAKQLLLKYDYAEYDISHSSHRFLIRSRNSEGRAQNASLISVPASDKIIQLYFSFYEIRRSTCAYGKLMYVELIWRLPKEHPDVSNFTLYLRREYDMTNSYGIKMLYKSCNFIILPSNVSKHTISIDMSKGYSFEQWETREFCRIEAFLSVNTKNSSTGLIYRNTVIDSVYDIRWKTKSSRKHPDLNTNENELDTKPTVDIGWRFSKTDEEQKIWMKKLLSNTCVIRIAGISNQNEKECFP